MPKDRYFLKYFSVDPDTDVVTPLTKLYPFYGSAGEEEKFDRQGEVRELAHLMPGMTRTVNGKPGRDLFHGASGIGYVKPGSDSLFSSRNDDGGYDTESVREKLGYDEAVERMLGRLHKLNDELKYRRSIGQNGVLMLCKAPENGIIRLKDLEEDNWDAWRDWPEEYQFRYYTPVEQLDDSVAGFDGYIKKNFSIRDPGTLSDGALKNIAGDVGRDYDALMRDSYIKEALYGCL